MSLVAHIAGDGCPYASVTTDLHLGASTTKVIDPGVFHRAVDLESVAPHPAALTRAGLAACHCPLSHEAEDGRRDAAEDDGGCARDAPHNRLCPALKGLARLETHRLGGKRVDVGFADSVVAND